MQIKKNIKIFVYTFLSVTKEFMILGLILLFLIGYYILY